MGSAGNGVCDVRSLVTCAGLRPCRVVGTQSALSRGAEAAARASITSPASVSGVKASSPSETVGLAVLFSYPCWKVDVADDVPLSDFPSPAWVRRSQGLFCESFLRVLFPGVVRRRIWHSLARVGRAAPHTFQA